MAGYRIISSDNHVIEPPDLWTTRIEGRFTDRAPRVVRIEGFDYWLCEGLRLVSMAGGAQAGRRFEGAEKLSRRDVHENVRPGGYIPDEYVKDMDIDSVDAGIIFPTVGLLLYGVPDGELLTAICHVYNDWIAEFCQAHPKRLNGIAMLNVDDIQSATRELERCAKLGLVGAMVTAYPPEDRPFSLPEYEPLWAAAEELGIPLALHSSTNRSLQQVAAHLTINFIVNLDYWVRMSLTSIIMGGVFERHPNLQLGAVEWELSWIPHFLDRIDYLYTQRSHEFAPHRFSEDMLPSDYFHRNLFASFQEDAIGIRLRDVIGVDCLLWGSDYPHQESTFPRSRKILEEVLASCTEEEKSKIAGGNAARVYGID